MESTVRKKKAAGSGQQAGNRPSSEGRAKGRQGIEVPDDHYGPSGRPEWLDIDWREYLHQIDLDGARVNYVEMGRGDGIPVVLVHGLSGSWQNWLENMPFFAQQHRVLALDLPGFGHSPMPEWEISISRYAAMLDEFCDKLDVGKCGLVGNSMGGFISAEVAINHPERAEKLVLVSAAGISHATMRREPALAAARVARAAAPLAFKFRNLTMRRPGTRWLGFRGLFHSPHKLSPELTWEFFTHGVNAPGVRDAIKALIGYDFRDRLPEIQVPTLIIWGRNDRVVPARDSKEYLHLIPNARRVIFDKTGHIPMAERPDRFNRVADEFLDEASP